MTLKLEEYQKAADQYAELLKQDLEPPVAISADLPRPLAGAAYQVSFAV